MVAAAIATTAVVPGGTNAVAVLAPTLVKAWLRWASRTMKREGVAVGHDDMTAVMTTTTPVVVAVVHLPLKVAFEEVVETTMGPNAEGAAARTTTSHHRRKSARGRRWGERSVSRSQGLLCPGVPLVLLCCLSDYEYGYRCSNV